MSASIPQIETLLKEVKDAVTGAYLPVVTVIQVGVPEATTVVYNQDGGGGAYIQGQYCKTYFIADDDYEVVSINEVHENAITSADGASLMVSKLTGTTAPTAAILHLVTDTAFTGDDCTLKGFNLKGVAANTVTGATMTNVVSSLTLASGNRLCYGINGTLNSTVITIQTMLRRI
jgi:hypothetical protein